MTCYLALEYCVATGGDTSQHVVTMEETVLGLSGATHGD